MTFADYIAVQFNARAVVSVRVGMDESRQHASLMTWSDKTPGTHFWMVEGDSIKHEAFVGSEDAGGEV